VQPHDSTANTYDEEESFWNHLKNHLSCMSFVIARYNCEKVFKKAHV